LRKFKNKKAMHKAGFVNIVGKPNAGKSTLLNQLMGEKLAIVTQKAQTTRHRIFGIYNEEDVQIVFSDTPGVLDPKYELQEKMMGFVKESLQDADVFLFIVDISDKSEPSEFLIEKLNKIPIPVLLLINKIDKSNQKEMEAAVEHWHNLLPKAEILPISALNAYNTEYILPKLKSLLPENPPYYDKDQFTDKSERFFVNETVREKILLNYEKEIPYSVEVVTELFKEKEGIIFIDSIIYVERETQKGILIGHKGEAIKKVGTEARLDLEKFFAKKIHLNLFVKVKKDWRKNEKDLKNFGYR
jgi:GTP-binding protein era